MKLFALALCLLTAYSSFAETTSSSGTEYDHFTAYNDTQTCTSESEGNTDFNIRGVSLGGWMVLEAWVTPSLFYQFLGKEGKDVGMDHYSFCEALGPKEGNKQFRRHADAWVTEAIIKELADSGAVNSVRLPVGDWMFAPYGPYVGCTDGSVEYVDQLLDWCEKYGISVLFDLHGVKGSQNGYDNSGHSTGLEWTSDKKQMFQHWSTQEADWIGTFDKVTATYTDINWDHINYALDIIDMIVDRYGEHPAVLGLEPLNEPWELTPLEPLKKFYFEGYLRVKKKAPQWMFIMHDSNRYDPAIWRGFMAGCPDKVLDIHIYQAWKDPSTRENFYDGACAQKNLIQVLEEAFGPVVVGEWALGTDNCVMWLSGFNDNLPGFPKLPCKYVDCPDPYMGFDQPGAPVDPGLPAQGPFGTGTSTPVYGQCPISRDWHKKSSKTSGTNLMHLSAEAPPEDDVTTEVVSNIAHKLIDSFSNHGHGYYFWNFRIELPDPNWSYMLALERGIIPTGDLKAPEVANSCEKEDAEMYSCVARRGQKESKVRDTVHWIVFILGIGGDECVYMRNIDKMVGEELYQTADCVYDKYWKNIHGEIFGMSCVLEGTAMLVEVNETYAADDDIDIDDIVACDGINKGLRNQEFFSLLAIGALFGAFLGFAVSMVSNKKGDYTKVPEVASNKFDQYQIVA